MSFVGFLFSDAVLLCGANQIVHVVQAGFFAGEEYSGVYGTDRKDFLALCRMRDRNGFVVTGKQNFMLSLIHI